MLSHPTVRPTVLAMSDVVVYDEWQIHRAIRKVRLRIAIWQSMGVGAGVCPETNRQRPWPSIAWDL
jgi:hypothetical protein